MMRDSVLCECNRVRRSRDEGSSHDGAIASGSGADTARA